MKALKEKRVSLRSLFRRSLVILSLLALAFAMGSCADTSGDSGGGDTPPPPPPPPVAPVAPLVTLKTVTGMTVLSHPYLPSFEGAAVDLTGLKVLVFFEDYYGVKSAFPVGPDKIAVYPSIAYVDDAAVNNNYFSYFNQYTILYNGDDAFPASSSTRQNVYIPGVVALADYTDVYEYPNGGAHQQGIKLSKIGKVYEDIDISPDGLTLTAKYVGPINYVDVENTMPVDYVSDRWLKGTRQEPLGAGEGDWPLWPINFTSADRLTKPASRSSDVWRIDPIKRTGEYLIRVPDPASNLPADPVTGDVPDFLVIWADIDNFFEVDRFDYIEGSGDFRYISLTADDKMDDWMWWWKVFNYANLKFIVTYFDKKAPGGPVEDTREIGVNEYTRAMYTTDSKGNAKATVPILTGNPKMVPNPKVPGAQKPDESNILTSVQDDYLLSARLFYYDRLIQGGPGQGKLDLTDPDFTGAGLDLYEQPNYALVPITESNIIFLYSGLDVTRKDNTAHPDETAGWPYAVSGADDQYNADNVYKMLTRYWKAEWVYTNENRPGEEKRTPVDAWGGAHGIPAKNEYGFAVVDEDEDMTITINFSSPPSENKSQPNNDEEWEFGFLMRR